MREESLTPFIQVTEEPFQVLAQILQERKRSFSKASLRTLLGQPSQSLGDQKRAKEFAERHHLPQLSQDAPPPATSYINFADFMHFLTLPQSADTGTPLLLTINPDVFVMLLEIVRESGMDLDLAAIFDRYPEQTPSVFKHLLTQDLTTTYWGMLS